MKRYLLLMVFCFSCLQLMAQDHDLCPSKEIFLEDFNREHLRNEQCFPWFTEGYNHYRPDADKIKELQKIRDHISIKIIGGSWCDDTHILLPRLYKVTEQAGIPDANVELTGVGRDKKDAHGNHPLEVDKVPLIVFYFDGEEAGRIVESVSRPVEEEMLDIYMKHLAW